MSRVSAQAVPTPKVLIAGAGPTGLTAAVELARRGVPFRIVDRAEGPTPLSKAVGISPHSLDLLEPSGVTERLLQAGVRIQRVHVHQGDRRLATVRFAGLRHRFNFLLALPQSETEGIMASLLAERGVGVEWRTELTGLAQTPDMVAVTLHGPDGPEQASFEQVLGADGARSRVREAIGVEFAGHRHERVWSIADVEMADWPYEPGSANAFFLAGGDVAFAIPIGPARFRVLSNTADALALVPGAFRVERVLCADTFLIPVRQATSYRVGRVALAGDAGHVHSPVGGRGMNLGIEDAVCYARRLADGSLDGYDGERRPVGHRWIAFSERALAGAQSEGALRIAIRNTVLRLVDRFPGLQRPLLERIAGVRE